MAPAVQCVASYGGLVLVKAITRSRIAWPSGRMRDGRVLSCTRPPTPSVMNRSRQRQTQVLDLPVSRMTAFVPRPAAVRSTIRARQTCFCGLFRSRTIASKRSRSTSVSEIEAPGRMPQTHTRHTSGESPAGLKRQILSTRADCGSIGGESVAAVLEPAAGVLGRDRAEGVGQGDIEGIRGAGRGGA